MENGACGEQLMAFMECAMRTQCFKSECKCSSTLANLCRNCDVRVVTKEQREFRKKSQHERKTASIWEKKTEVDRCSEFALGMGEMFRDVVDNSLKLLWANFWYFTTENENDSNAVRQFRNEHLQRTTQTTTSRQTSNGTRSHGNKKK